MTTKERTSSPSESSRAWLIRAGEGGFALTGCVDASVIALRYAYVADARTLSRREIAAGVARAGTRVNYEGVAAICGEVIGGDEPRRIWGAGSEHD